eukprot:Gb_32644 [translate_table: standard]
MVMALSILQPPLQCCSCQPFTKLWPLSLTIHTNRNNHRRTVCALNLGEDIGRAKEREGVESSRKEALRRLDFELEKGREKEAVSLITSLQGKPGGLRGFGPANQHRAKTILQMAEMPL